MFPGKAAAQCSAPANAIVAENCLTGNPDSEWDVSTGDAGDPSIQGFATDISVNSGGTVFFKVKTDARAYVLNIYRMGYYAGRGARKVASILPSASLPQTQGPCLTDSTTGLYDCGSWAVSASWQVPANATSGIYFAHLIRTDNSKNQDSHIVFIVRNDASHSDMLFQTGDESWQAYNYYGGGSLYGPNTPTFALGQRAFKASYNRPFLTRGFDSESATWVFGSEYPMIRWLESNGYDVTYFTGVDAARNGSLIQNHKVYVTSGHDEYWSGPHRANVEAARNAGVNMAFFAGNEVFWKTRWENSIDGSNSTYRTLVCYKETLATTKIDPTSTWTGTWRDPSFSPPSDGGRPENALTGTLFMVNGPGNDNNGSLAIKVPAADGKMRFWRNTGVASLAVGATYTLPSGTLAYEWDSDVDNGARPAGAFPLSTSTYTMTTDLLLDFGATYGAGPATHHMMMYRAPSGAKVFGSGTVQWAWGLDSNHDNPFGFQNPSPDKNMQQATVNLFADMSVQPASLQPGLVAATASTDHTVPSSTISSPAPGSNLTVGSPVAITGTASDTGGGVVAAVEVSGDGGSTWHPATGRGTWTYSLTPTNVGSTTIRSRAVDDSGNLETPAAGVAATVVAHDCPCSAWNPSTIPATPDAGDTGSGEFGVKFRADYAGYITGVRFYKSAKNTGVHKGSLWSSTGALLASATFTNESASGWQQVTFSTPVAVNANTTYIASYFAPVGHYSAQAEFFALAGLDNPPIHLLRNGIDGPNGVFSYGSQSLFPATSFGATSYWVDPVYLPAGSMPNAPPSLLVAPAQLTFAAYTGQPNPPSQSVNVYNQGTSALSWTASASTSWINLSSASGTTPQSLAISINTTGLAVGSYTGTVTLTAPGGTGQPQTVAISLTVNNLLFSSNFATQGAQGWVVSPLGSAANWSIAHSALEYNGAGDSQIYAGNSTWTDYTVNAQFKLSTAQNWPGGIRGRVNPATGAGYMLWIYPQQGQIILFKTAAWNITQSLVQLGAATASFDTSNYHTLSLSFTGTQIRALYDGNALITVTDTAYANGLVALEGDTQVIDFQSVVATASNPNSGSLATSAASLTFNGSYGGAAPAAQTVQLTAASGILAWTASTSASWLAVSPNGGNTPGTLQVSVNTAGLPPGTSNGTLSVVSFGAANSTQLIPVTVNLSTTPPSLVASPTTLNFTGLAGQAAPPAQALTISNGGFGTLSWSAASDSPWLTVSPAAGSTPGSVSASVNLSGLANGTYTGHIILAASGVANSPLSVPVTLSVLSADMTETFSDGGSGWIVSPMGLASGWTASSGIYSYNGGGASQTCTGNTAWTDYSVDANIKLSSLANWPGGIRARVNPSTGAGYLVWLYPGSGLAVLYKVGQWNVNGAQLTSLGQASVAFDATSPHDLQLAFSGSSITVAWDGHPLIQATDTAYTAGFVCLDADNRPIAYSNIRVAAVQPAIVLATPSPASLIFSALPGANPPPQNVVLGSSGGSVAWAATSSAAWLTPTLSSGFAPGSLTASVNPAGMAEGTYTATITISAPGTTNSPLTIPVTLAVKTAVLAVAPSSLTFFGSTAANPASRTLTVQNAGSGALAWSAGVGSAWLGLSPSSGSAPGTLTVQPNTVTLATGIYSDSITVSSPDVANPASIPVALQVGTPLFSDNFSAGAGNWTISPLGNAAGWSVSNSVYSYNGAGHTQSWAGSNSWTNYTAAVNFQLASLIDYPGGLRGRVNISTGAGYTAWIYPAERVIKLFRVDQWNIDTSSALLAQSAAPSIDTGIHNLRLVFQGSTIQVYLDNVLAITANDSTYTQGAIALDVSNQPIAFSSVDVIGF